MVLHQASFRTPTSLYCSVDYPLMIPFGTSSFNYTGPLGDFRDNLLYDIKNPDILHATSYYSYNSRKISIPFS